MQASPVMIDGVRCADRAWRLYRRGRVRDSSIRQAGPWRLPNRLLARSSREADRGLGARDSLRLEAGMCLYGHDIDTTKTPISASLAWTGSARRGAIARTSRRAAHPRRNSRIGPASKRGGISRWASLPREGTEVQSADGKTIGVVTSGGFGPTVNGPVSHGHVETAFAKTGTPLKLIVRGRRWRRKSPPCRSHRIATNAEG